MVTFRLIFTYLVNYVHNLKPKCFLDSFDRIRPGDAIVCFKKNDIYHVSRQLEKMGMECAVIYGTLPPGIYCFFF